MKCDALFIHIPPQARDYASTSGGGLVKAPRCQRAHPDHRQGKRDAPQNGDASDMMTPHDAIRAHLKQGQSNGETARMVNDMFFPRLRTMTAARVAELRKKWGFA